MTVRDLIGVALTKLGILGEGRAPSGNQGAAGVRCLNSLLDAFPLERHLVYVIDRQTFALVANTQTYTLGPGGTWNTTPLYGVGSPRPEGIESAFWQDPSTLDELPVWLLDEQAYRDLEGVRSLTATVVQRLYYAPQMPQGSVFVWPKPTVNANIILFLQRPFDRQTTLDSLLAYPPGYQRLLEYGLAQELGTEYPGSLRPEIVAVAEDAKRLVKMGNAKPSRMTSDLLGVTGMRRSTLTSWDTWMRG
jgi:hypothetical protein